MKEDTASRTAIDQARIRAIESLVAAERRVCYDPLAVVFLDERFQRTYEVCQRSRFQRTLLISAARRDPAGTKTEAVARTKYIDDYLQACVSSGVEQVVILGAGYDSRAYRLDALKKVKVFEVDHPNTQKTKMARLKKTLGHLPSWVTYVPVDFEKDELDEKLAASGYKRDLRALFIWEGVTMYLTAESVDRTLAFVVANSGQGSSIIFNHWHRSAAEGNSKVKWAETVKRRCEQMGEPIRFGIEGSEIEAFMVARGFSEVKRVTASALTELCFKATNSKRRVCPFTGIVHATVGLSR